MGKLFAQDAHLRGYYATPEGDAIGLKGRKLTLRNMGGYLVFTARVNGESKPILVHQLVAYQKFGEKYLLDESMVARHLDGNSLNNSWENIGIGTTSENILDILPADRHAKAMHAAKHKRRFSDEQVHAIKAMYASGLSYKEIGACLSINKSTLSYILSKTAARRAQYCL